MVDRLYRCPACGDTLTEEEYIMSFDSGGIGYCPCEFLDGERTYHEYDVYVREQPNEELGQLKQRLLDEIDNIKKELWQPVNPWNPESGEVSPMVRRRQRNEELVKLQDLYERCFPKVERVLDLLRERYRKRVLS